MADMLTKFILETAGEEWRFGWSDCAPWVARWIEGATGRPVLAHVPDYSNVKGSVRVVRAAGGMKLLFQEIAGRVGLKECLVPRRGDVGLLRHPQAMEMQILAICLGNGKWIAKVSETAQNATFTGVPLVAWKVIW